MFCDATKRTLENYEEISQKIQSNKHGVSPYIRIADPLPSQTNTNQTRHEPIEVRHEPDEVRNEPDEVRHEPDEVRHEPDEVRHEPDEVRHEPDEVRHEPDCTILSFLIIFEHSEFV